MHSVFTIAMKLKDANYKSHWNILAFCDQWYMTSDLNMSYGKMSDFASFSFLAFNLVKKLKNFDFWSHWNTLTFLDKKNMVYDLNMSFE